MILNSLFDVDPILIALDPNHLLDSSQQSKLKSVLEDMLTEKPLQYILGEVSFRKLNLKVNPSVLIPRPETEELVGWILEDYAKLNQKIDLIDLGTGSGCIALSLKKEQPYFNVHALDIDQPILDVVEQNKEKNKLEINCIKGDINDLLKLKLKLKLKVIVSNPPYISPKDKEEIKNNVLNFEPHQALFVPQDNPLLYYQKILEFAGENLKSKGRVYFEINPLFESEMEALIFSFDSYTITKRLDIFGKIRMLRLEKK
jgi:release factor glutamine methyltransferase